MTIFRCDLAIAMIDDLLADEGPWWEDEIETVTGYRREEYESLRGRLTATGFSASIEDREMLHAAANNLLGYPGISTVHTASLVGDDWKDLVQGFFLPRAEA